MDIMQPITQATALSSFPILKEANVTKVISNSSTSSDRSSTRTSSLTTSESSKKVLYESLTPLERSAKSLLEDGRIKESNYDHTVRRYNSSDLLKLETDRESVINLARFLRTTEPPPSSYMSLPDGGQRQIQDKKLPFKILRRQSAKKAADNTIKTLQLPDSAVAAKTSQGHWHIAISIPVEYDHQKSNTTAPSQTTQHSKTQSETVIRNRPITVVKPEIGNVRPAAIDRTHTKSQSHDDSGRTILSPRPLSIPPLRGAEAERILPALYDQQAVESVSQMTNVEVVQSNQYSGNDNDTVISDAARPQSQRSDVWRSGETDSTVQSAKSSTYHTRGQSSISTASSINFPASPRAIWPHKRQSSASNHVLDQIEQSIATHMPSTITSSRLDDSRRPPSAGSDMSLANFNMAATAQGYGPDMPGTQVVYVRRATQTPSYRARIARRPLRNSSAEHILSSQNTISKEYSPATPNGVDLGGMTQSRQSRRERVKAIRSRDMAKVRAMKKYHQVMASVIGQDIPITPASSSSRDRIEPYRGHGQKRSLSYTSIAEETAVQKTLHSMTSIVVVADVEPSEVYPDIRLQPAMLVADLEPSKSLSDLSAPASSALKQRVEEKDGRMRIRKSPHETHTPPHSIPSSPTSFDGEHRRAEGVAQETQTLPQSIPQSSTPFDAEAIHSLKPRQANTITSADKRYNSVHRNQIDLGHQVSIPDEDTDLRMRKLENINAVIFRTLNAVVEMGVCFGELRQILPAESSVPDKALPLKENHPFGDEDQDPVGSLIRELRGAVKIGQEELAKYGAMV